MSTLPYKYASDEQLQYIHEPVRYVLENYDVGITIRASENTKAMSNVDPKKLALEGAARKELFATMLKRIAEREYRWVGSQFPTNAHAQEADMSLEEYSAENIKEDNLIFENPVGQDSLTRFDRPKRKRKKNKAKKERSPKKTK